MAPLLLLRMPFRVWILSSLLVRDGFNAFMLWHICKGSTLLCFITLKELDKAKGGSAKFWIMYFVHRYIRYETA